jgi:hypothetical protein
MNYSLDLCAPEITKGFSTPSFRFRFFCDDTPHSIRAA